jgi:hypothetical protein
MRTLSSVLLRGVEPAEFALLLPQRGRRYPLAEG